MGIDLFGRGHVFGIALADFLPVGLHGEAVRQHLLEGRLPGRAERRQQRELEPSAVLVRPFQIQIGRKLEVAAALKDRVPTAARFEPDVEDVLLLPQLVRREAGRVEEGRAEQLVRICGEPTVGAVLAEILGNRAH